MGPDTASQDRRKQSRSSVYRYLYEKQGFCSKQALAHALGLSLPTVYQNLTELMNLGLVRYSGEQQSTGGRRANGLEIVPDARVAVGISITENRLRLSAADLRLNELAYEKLELAPYSHFSTLGDLVSRELERFLELHQVDRARLLGVGIALPAVITPDGSHVLAAPTLQLQESSLEGLTRDIPYPTYVQNDGTCGGYAEWFSRSGRQNMAYLSLENGVGGAVLVNGAPYLGNHRRSGEFGHMCVEAGGLPCHCGKQGCLEAYCSARRISDDLGITLKDFFAGVERHEPEYEMLWYDLLRHLAVGVNNIRMALDCDVVLGGFLSEYLPPYLARLKDYAAGINTFEGRADYLHLSTLRRHTVSLGAALHFITDFLGNI